MKTEKRLREIRKYEQLLDNAELAFRNARNGRGIAQCYKAIEEVQRIRKI